MQNDNQIDMDIFDPMEYDAIEVHGVRDIASENPDEAAGGTMCEVDDDDPQFFSVYGHLLEGGVECLGDFDTPALASSAALALGERFGLTVMNFVPGKDREPMAHTFYGIDALIRLATSHPEFEWMRNDGSPDSVIITVSRKGVLYNGEMKDDEVRLKRLESAVWDKFPERMQLVAAKRKALELAFPEYASTRKDLAHGYIGS